MWKVYETSHAEEMASRASRGEFIGSNFQTMMS